MKDGVKDIVGKTITSVVVGSGDMPPRAQVFLIFTDGTSFEFYGEAFSCCGGLDRQDVNSAQRYIRKAGGSVNDVYP